MIQFVFRILRKVSAVASILVLSFGVGVRAQLLPPPAQKKIDFVRDIQPILAQRCYSCHGPDNQENDLRWDTKSSALKGGASGPAIIPGKSEESRMIHLVAGLEKNLVMPKKGERLAAEKIGLLRAWIDQGANWPDEVATPKSKDKSDWWSFKTASPPSLPKVKNEKWERNPIDRFILVKLEQEKFSPSPEACRRTLIRRLSFDLVGLPPKPEEVEKFLTDTNPQAYENLVDRLLDSPRYGERWARHWLDVVHFGETHGYDKDKPRTNAWPYRDYVIRSLNKDKPYSRFVQEQLAGDVLFPDEPDGIAALGFVAAGPWDFVGHVELPIEKTDGLIARYNDRDDMVMTTISTFQSLTVHCARCHDHKFDPITQKEYYSLQAVFAGVDRADRPYDSDKNVFLHRRLLKKEKKNLEARYAALTNEIAKATSPELQQLDVEIKRTREEFGATNTQKNPSNGYHSGIEKTPDVIKWVQVDLGTAQNIEEVRLVPARPVDFPDTPGFGFPLRFRVEISNEPDFKKAEMLAELSGIDFPNPGDKFFPIIVNNQTSRFVRVAATKLWPRTDDYVFALAELQVFSRGTNVALHKDVSALDSIEAGLWSKKYLVDGFSSRARLENIKSSAGEKNRRAETESKLQMLEQKREEISGLLISAEIRSGISEITNRLGEIQQKINSLPTEGKIYAVTSDFVPNSNFIPAKTPRPVHLLARGDVKQPRDLMSPAGIAAVSGPEAGLAKYLLEIKSREDSELRSPSPYPSPPGRGDKNFPSSENLSALPKGGGQASLSLGERAGVRADTNDFSNETLRRAALAKWITDPKNMLTRRSIVNRVWQYHFGRGIVETANDFGHMGALPSHPELLDWLAFWFQENGESLKKLHRLIVTSSTYRQSSSNNSGFAKLDSDNRYLWRMNRTRLDAESIRDAMLSVSGKLDLKMSGPSVQQFYFKDDHSPVYDYTKFDVDSSDGNRRSIYRFLVRSVPDPLMDSLDCPDASILTPKRNVTMTSLQALAILNDPFVVKQSEDLANRVASAGNLEEQINEVYRLALNRLPTDEEIKKLETFAQKNSMPNLCRLIFNMSEFMFVD